MARDIKTASRVLSSFESTLRRARRLSRDEESSLSARIRGGDERALAELVESNIAFAVKIALEFRGRGTPFEDLLNAANLGLVEAAHRYDGDRKVPFIGYAVWWIRKSIFDLIRNGGTVRLPRGSTTRRDSGEEAEQPRAVRPKMPLRILALEDLPETTVLNLLAGCLTAPVVEGVEERLLNREASRLVRDAVSALPGRERFIIRRRFGLDGKPCETLQEIGRQLGVSREWVRQVEVRAKSKIRRRMLAALSRGADRRSPSGDEPEEPPGPAVAIASPAPSP